MNHPFLQFNGRRRRDRASADNLDALWPRRSRIGEPRRLNWDVMTELNQTERLTNMISIPMARLLDIRQPVYLQLTLEFFASYSYDKPSARQRPDFHNDTTVHFRLGGVWYEWTVERLGLALGIYTEEEVHTPAFDAMYRFQGAQQKAEFWNMVAEGPPYVAQSAKASRLRDPLLRVLHHIFSHTICGRMDSSGHCPTPDLLFLYTIATSTPINLAARMAEFFMNSAGRTDHSEIHGGEYVTQIAHHVGLLTPQVVAGLTLVHVGSDVDVRSLKSMGLIVETENGPRLRGLHGEIWDPVPPQGDDEDDDDDDDEQHQQHQHHQEAHMPDAPAYGEGMFLGGDQQHQHHQEQHQHQQHHHQEHHQYQHHQQDWPGDIPPYPEFYRQFQELQVETREHRRETNVGFAFIIGGLQQAFPDHFQDPPQFPFDPRRYDAPHDQPGPSSRTRRRDQGD